MTIKIKKDCRTHAIIVASGPSAIDIMKCNIDSSKHAIIAVNGVADWLPMFDYWFTLDPSPKNMRRMINPNKNAQYYVAYPDSLTMPKNVIQLMRNSVDLSPQAINFNGKPTCDIGLNTNEGVINSGNSAFGALGLAYQLGFQKVALVGVDANKKIRVEGGYSRDLSHLPQLFESAMSQIEIINCGQMRSKIPTLYLKDYLQCDMKL